MALGQVVVNGTFNALSSRQFLAGNGSYFTVNNPTPGTGVAYAQLASFSATANGMFVIANNNAIGTAASPGKSIYLDRLELQQTATVATGAVMHFEVFNETGIVAGTTAVNTITPVQLNTSQFASQTTGATVQAFLTGAITIPAAVGTRRKQAEAWIETGVNVINDTYVVDFGADGVAVTRMGLTAARATDPARLCTQANPIVIAPQTTSWINCWGLGTSTPSFEYQLTYIEI